MSTTMDNVAKIIKEAKLSVYEGIGVIQDLGIIEKCEKVSSVDILNGYKKIKELMETKDINDMDLFQVEFTNIVNELFTEFNIEHGYKNIKPIMEFAGSDKGANVERGESESDPEFLKRKREADKSQGQKEKDFSDEHAGQKKNESEPLAKALRSKGLSQNELADKLNMNKSTISRLKSGERMPSFDTLQKLADTFGSVENIFPALK